MKDSIIFASLLLIDFALGMLTAWTAWRVSRLIKRASLFVEEAEPRDGWRTFRPCKSGVRGTWNRAYTWLMNRRRSPVLASLALVLCLVGCMKPGAYVIKHPGAVNQVDDQLDDAILTARGTLEAAKLQVTTYPALQAILNAKVIPPFNQLEAAYITYHNALVAGQAADATPLQTQLAAVTAALADALKSAGVTK